MITVEKMIEQKQALEKQREQLVDTLRQVVGGIQVLDYLIAEDQKEEAPQNAALPFPEVCGESTTRTEADAN
jgi:hypothetical protein